MKTNSYNIYDENYSSTIFILYHAVATDEDEVRELAEAKGYDLEGLTIELERSNVKDQLGRPFAPFIEAAQVY